MYVDTLPYLTQHRYFLSDHGDDVDDEEEKDGPWQASGKARG